MFPAHWHPALSTVLCGVGLVVGQSAQVKCHAGKEAVFAWALLVLHNMGQLIKADPLRSDPAPPDAIISNP